MKTKLLVTLAASVLALGGLAACSGDNNDTEKELETVKVGFHTNLGAGAGYSAKSQGFFEEEGINAEVQTGAGPALAAALVAGQIDVSFMGNGVAWNYFTSKEEIKLVALDNLTDDDRLIATTTGKGKDLTVNSPIADLAAALKGAKVALDMTATPATFWSGLVGEINKTFTNDADKIWYEGTDGSKLPNGLTTYNDASKVIVANIQNANLTSAMQNKEYDFCVSFAPIASTLEKQTANFKTVARTSTHMAGNYTPSTWAVNTAWLKTHEATFKKFMKGLVRGMNFRAANAEKTCEDVEKITAGAVMADSLKASVDTAVWLDSTKQLEIINNGKAMTYVNNIRNSQLAGANKDKVAESVTAEKAANFSYLKEACEAIK